MQRQPGSRPGTRRATKNERKLKAIKLLKNKMQLNLSELFYLNTYFSPPKNILIDHNMVVQYKLEGYDEELLENYIQELINNIEN